jgi:hypothetical protein
MLLPAERRYLEELVTRLERCLPGLVGVYLFGSGAYGDHDPARSDLDVQAVVAKAPPRSAIAEVVAAVGHAALACPARRLELVVYPRAAVTPPPPTLAFALNLNSGPGLVDRVVTDPAAEEPHWFVLDVAIGREMGVALLGPPPSEVFAAVAHLAVVDALTHSLAWHLEREPMTPNTVLNACRAWHHAETGAWLSKAGAADWVLARRPDLGIVGDAVAARSGGRLLPGDHVQRLVEEAAKAVRRAPLEPRR